MGERVINAGAGVPSVTEELTTREEE